MNNLKIEAKKRQDGRTVLLRFSYTNQGRKYFSTGVIISADQFDPKNVEKPVNKSHPNHRRLNGQIQEILSRIDNIRSRLVLEKIAPTAETVFHLFHQNDELKVGDANDPKVSALYDEFLGAKNYGAATEKLYRTLFKQFDQCYKALKVSEFDIQAWNGFKTFLATRKVKGEKRTRAANTICIRLAKLKAFVKHLKANGYHIPLSTFPMPKEEVKMVGMDLRELDLIRKYTPETEAYKRIKDLCLFQCFTGLRISDLKRLDKSHIVDRDGQACIKMNAYKTDRKIFIPLTAEGLEILNRYAFVLPVCVEQYYNRGLKKLLNLAGIHRAIEWQTYDANGAKVIKRKRLCDIFTNHCCSRTAITYWFSEGWAPHEVAAIVGKSHDTIMKYYLAKATEDDILRKAKKMSSHMQIAA